MKARIGSWIRRTLVIRRRLTRVDLGRRIQEREQKAAKERLLMANRGDSSHPDAVAVDAMAHRPEANRAHWPGEEER